MKSMLHYRDRYIFVLALKVTINLFVTKDNSFLDKEASTQIVSYSWLYQIAFYVWLMIDVNVEAMDVSCRLQNSTNLNGNAAETGCEADLVIYQMSSPLPGWQ